MEPPPPAADPSAPGLPPGFEEVGRYATERDAADHGLVVLAMRLGYWVEPVPGGYSLRVAAPVADEVRAQLALYDRESEGWPPRAGSLAGLRFRPAAPAAWVALCSAVFWLQQARPGLEAAGALDARAVFGAGEWWRPLTALFLHADLGHLVANLAAGFFLFGLVLGALGSLRGGLALAAASLAGNILAAALHPRDGYASLGASTAVFAALGLLTGAAVREALARPGPVAWRALLLPALAGGTLLALHGAGDFRTDVVAHGTGFAAGALIGALAGARRDRAPR